MIVYNIRANGPYEYDKFMLNFGQLYNHYADTKDAWKASAVWKYDKALSKKISDATAAWSNRDHTSNSILSRLALIKEILTE